MQIPCTRGRCVAREGGVWHAHGHAMFMSMYIACARDAACPSEAHMPRTCRTHAAPARLELPSQRQHLLTHAYLPPHCRGVRREGGRAPIGHVIGVERLGEDVLVCVWRERESHREGKGRGSESEKGEGENGLTGFTLMVGSPAGRVAGHLPYMPAPRRRAWDRIASSLEPTNPRSLPTLGAARHVWGARLGRDRAHFGVAETGLERGALRLGQQRRVCLPVRLAHESAQVTRDTRATAYGCGLQRGAQQRVAVQVLQHQDAPCLPRRRRVRSAQPRRGGRGLCAPHRAAGGAESATAPGAGTLGEPRSRRRRGARRARIRDRGT